MGDESDGAITDKNNAMIMFAMVCLQIAHPEIYQLFADNPNYKEWDDVLAYKETQGKEKADKNFEQNFENAIKTENFDEPWEQCLFKVCYLNPRRRAKATEISEFISLFDKEFPEDVDVISLIRTVLRQTAVTSVTSKENPNVRPPGSTNPFVTGYDAWVQNAIEKKDLAKKVPNFPTQATEEIIKNYINFIKAAPAMLRF